MLDRWSGRELADARLVGNVPSGAMVIWRIEVGALKRGDGPVDGTFTLAGDTSQRILGSTAKGPARVGGQRTGARSAPRPSFGLPELLVAIHTSRQSCSKAGKARIFALVWESSGESRIKTLGNEKNNRRYFLNSELEKIGCDD